MGKGSMNVLALLVCVSWCAFNAASAAKNPSEPVTRFNVGSYGSKGTPSVDDAPAFLKAWQAACASSGRVVLEIPKGTYYLSQVKFIGPCPKVTSLSVKIQGTLMATTDLSKYQEDYWITFGWMTGLRLSGGTFNGQGSFAWHMNSCSKRKDCTALPVSVKFMFLNDTIVKGITSVNPKFFHTAVIDCNKFRATNMTISAPEDSPNTDGMHIERSSDVRITNTNIGTGDDCISVGHGNTNMLLQGIKCGPGHGISIGSLGKYQYEKDVKGIMVKDCVITGAMNGVRIKSWENSPASTVVSNVTFENIEMKNVSNAIIIDQEYCPHGNCGGQPASRVKLSGIHFNNIWGTSATPVAVTLKCSKGYPCQDVVLKQVYLKHISGMAVTAACDNASPKFSGTVVPSQCSAVTAV